MTNRKSWDGDGPREDAMDRRFGKLVNTVAALYYAAHWSPDRDCDAEKLWEAVRDAAGFALGHSTEVLGPKRDTP